MNKPLIPKEDVYVLYTIKAVTTAPNRFPNYLKKFSKIERFIREWDLNHETIFEQPDERKCRDGHHK